MSVQQIHAFLVHPGKSGHEKRAVNGTNVPLSGSMFNLLGGIYDRSDEECDIDIAFRAAAKGKQQNDCRDLLVSHLTHHTLATGRRIAERLRDITDGRSGLGLLFIIAGKEGSRHKVVVSRFPTDSAIFVDEDPKKFTVEFLDRVFMKNKTSYKAAAYQDTSLKGGFWTGRAIDKQLNSGTRSVQLSDYWISDFLLSEFATTPAAGSRRLGQALRQAVKGAPLEVKEELIAAGRLANGLAGKPISINSFAEQFSLSMKAKTALLGNLKNPRTAGEQFKFDISEFRNYVAYMSVELSNGALLSADTANFENVFEKQYVDDTDEVKFSTQGKIVDEKLKSQR